MKLRVPILLLVVAALTAYAPVARAQGSSGSLIPFRTDTPPSLDGVLDDPVWKDAPSVTGFTTWFPDFGKPMSDETRVWYAFDSENLYFAFHCSDAAPDQIRANVTDRDRIRADDWVCINLDTFGDHQSMYAFYINPIGIQEDSKATALEEDVSVDLVWFSAGSVAADGYSVEVKIPFRSIRYASQDPVRMGVIFERRINRGPENGTFPAMDPDHGGNFVSQSKELLLAGVDHRHFLEFIPAVTWGTSRQHSGGILSTEDKKQDLSLTARYGITSDLTVEGTINPDFSQVESDAGQIDFNRRYAVFYPEKRPFFLEGRGLFDVGGLDAQDPLAAVVHTRTIGDPSVGIRLTGNLSARNSLAAIYARDELAPDRAEGRQADVAILRARRSLSEDSFVGGFYTSRHTDVGSNSVVGADGQMRIGAASLLGYHGFLSSTSDSSMADRSTGHAAGVSYWFNDRDWIVDSRLQDIDDGFSTETGYLTRTGLTRFKTGVLRMFFPEAEGIRRVDTLFHLILQKDHASGLVESFRSVDLRTLLGKNTFLTTGRTWSDEIFAGRKFSRDALRFQASSQPHRRLDLSTRVVRSNKIRYTATPFQGYGLDGSAAIAYRPTEHMSTSFSYAYSDFFRTSDDEKIYDYRILRSLNTYQVNRYVFFRAIAEFNSFYDSITTDLLASFTYIPGTVIYFGYGSLFEKTQWDDGTTGYVASDRFLETRRGLFFKASYLWRT